MVKVKLIHLLVIKVIVSLVNNDFIMEASQLLDEILLDYKQSLQFKYRPSKHQISNLIGSFLKAFIMKLMI